MAGPHQRFAFAIGTVVAPATVMLSILLQDLRTGARLLARSPGFTLIAVLSLAVGIGANTATFSFADGLLPRPLPVPRASEVVTVGSINPATGGTELLRASYPDFVDLRGATDSFAGGLAAFDDIAVQLAPSPDATPEIRTATLVSGNFFGGMGVRPAIGRAFGPAEDEIPGRDAVAVLSHCCAVARRAFDLDEHPSAVLAPPYGIRRPVHPCPERYERRNHAEPNAVRETAEQPMQGARRGGGTDEYGSNLGPKVGEQHQIRHIDE